MPLTSRHHCASFCVAVVMLASIHSSVRAAAALNPLWTQSIVNVTNNTASPVAAAVVRSKDRTLSAIALLVAVGNAQNNVTLMTLSLASGSIAPQNFTVNGPSTVSGEYMTWNIYPCGEFDSATPPHAASVCVTGDEVVATRLRLSPTSGKAETVWSLTSLPPSVGFAPSLFRQYSASGAAESIALAYGDAPEMGTIELIKTLDGTTLWNISAPQYGVYALAATANVVFVASNAKKQRANGYGFDAVKRSNGVGLWGGGMGPVSFMISSEAGVMILLSAPLDLDGPTASILVYDNYGDLRWDVTLNQTASTLLQSPAMPHVLVSCGQALAAAGGMSSGSNTYIFNVSCYGMHMATGDRLWFTEYYIPTDANEITISGSFYVCGNGEKICATVLPEYETPTVVWFSIANGTVVGTAAFLGEGSSAQLTVYDVPTLSTKTAVDTVVVSATSVYAFGSGTK